MNSNRFIYKLINTTESSKEILWTRIGHPSEDYPSYRMKGQNGIQVELKQFDISLYADDGSIVTVPEVVAELQDEKGINLGYIYSRDLDDPDDLQRLYRIAQLNANDVDKLTDDFFGNS